MHLVSISFCCRISLLIALSAAQASTQHLFEKKLAYSGSNPSIARGNAGEVHIVWEDGSIRYAMLDSTGAVMITPVPVATGIFLESPSVGMGKESGLIVWRDASSSTFNSSILGRKVTQTGDLAGEAFRVDDDFRDSERFSPALAFVSDTLIAVAWGGTGPEDAIYGQRVSTRNGREGSTVKLSDFSSSPIRACLPKIAFLSQGDGVALSWLIGASPGNGIRIRRLTCTLVGLGPGYSPADDSSFSFFWEPVVSAAPNGRVAVAWSAQSSDSMWHVYRRHYDKEGNALTGIFMCSEDSVDYAASVSIATNSSGETLIVWEGCRDGHRRIIGQLVDSLGNQIGRNFVLSSQPYQFPETRPTVMLDGRMMVASWGSEGIWVVKADVTPLTSVDAPERSLSSDAQLAITAYPNPARGRISISVLNAGPITGSVTIYDILGREIAVLARPSRLEKMNTIVWDGRSSNSALLPSGVYYCRVVAGGQVCVLPILMLR